MKTHLDEATEELNREFPADRDYTPTPGLTKRLGGVPLLGALLIIIIMGGLIPLTAVEISNNSTNIASQEFKVLHLPACDNPNWTLEGDNTGSWFRINLDSYRVAVDKNGSVWLNHVQIISANVRGAAFYKCIAFTQLNGIR